MKNPTDSTVLVRPLAIGDYVSWRKLWDGYNAFYGRTGPTALSEQITTQTWNRLLDLNGPVLGLVAQADGRVMGIAHCVLHPSTSRLQDVCYLQDLFVDPLSRQMGIGRALIEKAIEFARARGCCRIYWQTQQSNIPGRGLYDQVAEHRGFIVYAREL